MIKAGVLYSGEISKDLLKIGLILIRSHETSKSWLGFEVMKLRRAGGSIFYFRSIFTIPCLVAKNKSPLLSNVIVEIYDVGISEFSL